MISETICCPHCGQGEPVVRHGYNRGGTARCCCKQCHKTFTPKPNPRTVTPEKEQSIRDALSELLSMDAIEMAQPSEMDELCISKRRNLGEHRRCSMWLWTLRPPSVVVAVSRYTGHLLAFVV